MRNRIAIGLILLYVISGIVLVQAMLRTKEGVEVEMNLEVKQLKFELTDIKGNSFLADANFKKLEIEKANAVRLFGDCLNALDGKNCQDLAQETLDILPDGQSLKLILHEVFFDKIDIAFPASIRMRSAEKTKMEVFNFSGQLDIYYDDLLTFRLQRGRFEGDDLPRPPVEAQLEAFDGLVQLKAEDGFILDMDFEGSSYTESQMEWTGMEFLEDLHTDEGDQISSIISGEISIDGLMEPLPWNQGILEIVVADGRSIHVHEMEIGKESINIQLSGKFDQLIRRLGDGKEELLPSWASWTWMNYKIQLILYGLLILGLGIIFLVRFLRPSRKKVIFLALANKHDVAQQYLPALAKERKLIEEAMARKRKELELLVVPDATIEDIFNKFKDPLYKERIQVFHFAGHGGGSLLEFESEDGRGEEANMKYLLQFLGEQSELELVFLNACETLSQLKYLQLANIPNAILTDRKISDRIASQFAQVFYENISHGFSYKDAYRAASQEVLSYANQAIWRSLDFGDEQEKDDLPWVGYFG